jgi:uncharacterized membrane protein
MRSSQRLRVLLTLAALSALAVLLCLVRRRLAHGGWYVYINWNLFLAWVPLGLALWAEALSRRPEVPRLKLAAVGGAWLLFFPNAPYVITDLIHIQSTVRVPLWHDALMIFTYALVSLLCGLFSLDWMRRVVARLSTPRWGWAMVGAVMPLAGFGIYLGRIERWNSWDILHAPHVLLWRGLVNLRNPHALLMTAEFALLLAVCYGLLLSLTSLRPEPHD